MTGPKRRPGAPGPDEQRRAELVERWRPQRAGVRNIWEYDDQVFAFADGRLILRGPNGSGKSNALALLFPFLLEGTMSAAAMDPFAGARSMRSLLLGELRDDDAAGRRFRHDNRLGYVWMELARHRPDGAEAHLTIGCGARAGAQSADARSWFFVTERRVGLGLDLAPGGEPLTRARLREVLDPHEVFDTAEAYRAAVDRHLFGLGADRQQKLVSLIRVLRRPQLAGKLDLSLLSQVLSGGLRAVDDAVLDDVAASLDDLEAMQRELADLRTTRSTIEAFLPAYRTYVTGEALTRGGAVTEAAATRRRSRGEVDARRDQVDALDGDLAANVEQRHQAAVDRSAATAERDAVIESPAFKDATALGEVEASTRRAEEVATQAARRHEEASGRATDADAAEAEAEALAAHERSEAERRLTGVVDLADTADVAWTLSATEAADADRLEAGAGVAERSRRRDLRVVRTARSRRDEAHRDHDRAERQASDALLAADRARQEAIRSAAILDEARSALADAVARWSATAPGLDAAGRSRLTEAVEALGDPGVPTLADRFRVLIDGARRSLVEARTRSDDKVGRLRNEATEVAERRAAVEAETDPGPDAPRWRRAVRADRPGAALWRCCDFAEAVAPAERAGLEAALDAAGILDAWLAPRPAGGEERPSVFGADVGGHGAEPVHEAELDAWIDVEGHQAPTGFTLAEILVAQVPDGSGLDLDTVGAALASVSLGAVGIAVSVDGRFVLGPLRGRATKDRAEYIGATARAERRRRLLAELDAEIKALEGAVATETAEGERLAGDLRLLDEAPDSLPDSLGLEQAAATLRTDSSRAEVASENATRATEAEADAAGFLASAERHLGEQATAHRLVPPDDEVLDAIAGHLDRLAQEVPRAVAARRRADREHQSVERDRARATEAARLRTEADDDHQRAAGEAAGLQARAATLRAQLGDDAEAPLAALARVEQRLRDLDDHDRGLLGAWGELRQALGEARQAHSQAEDAVAHAEVALAERSARLGVLRRRDLLSVLAADREPAAAATGDRAVDWAVGRPVERAADLPADPVDFARWLAARVPGTAPRPEQRERDQAALDKAQKTVLDELHHGYDASFPHEDGLVLVEVNAEARTFGLADLAYELAAQDERLQAYLTKGDQEVFERFLLNQVSHELRGLLTDADDFVAEVNRALATARTASGLQVELGWDLSTDDPAIGAAVKLLRHDTSQMGDAERSALRSFFERVIRHHRAEDPAAGYRAALEAALDYRAWHEFRPYLRTAEGNRVRLTRSQFRGLSGGEQAVALHLPLFAAAAAHYARAQPTAPRLIALDEAFAGIDEAMRGELMGLTVRFDLDVIMTGHELWGAYGEVPAVAVCDLLRRPPAEGVSVVTLRWDGHELTEPDDPPVSGASTASVAEADTGLFGGGDG
ncbi:TIGR02680 family protein [soil metagenome]